jgi:hypothetical protein
MLWVDLTNAPHVHLFKGFIKKHAEDIVVTTRRFGNLEEMLQAEGIKYTTVGSHGGSSKASKLVESARRVIGLGEFISRSQVEVAIAKQSVELPRVAFGLGIPVLEIVDNEHAEGQNRLFLSLCTRIIIPEALERDKLLIHGAGADKIRAFHGICEYEHIRDFEPNKAALGDLDPEEYILVRPGAEYAAYFKGTDETQKVIDSLTKGGYDVAVIPRGNERYDNAIQLRGVDSLSLIYFARAMVGGGGTMNRESALLGTPTVSFYPQELLGVDRFLVEEELLYHCGDIKDVLRMVEEVEVRKEQFREKSRILRDGMQSPIEIIDEEIKRLAG